MALEPPKDTDHWKLVASIDQIRKEHPDWSEEQCKAEMTRLATAEFEKAYAKTKNGKKAAEKPAPVKTGSKPAPKKKTVKTKTSQNKKSEKAQTSADASKLDQKPKRIRESKPGKTENGLKEQVELFCQEYCKNFGNATGAYRAAGYSPEGANKNAHRLMSDPRVQARIEEIKQEARSALKSQLAYRLDNDSILSEVAHVAYANISDFMHLDEDGEVAFDVTETFKVAPQKLAGLSGYEVIEMPPVVDVQGGIVQSRMVLKHKVKLDKMKGLELLMKHKNLLNDQNRTLNIDDLDKLIETQSESLAQRELALQARRGLAGHPPAAKPEVIDVEHTDVTDKENS